MSKDTSHQTTNPGSFMESSLEDTRRISQRQRPALSPLSFPTQQEYENTYRRPMCKKLQSPRVLQSLVASQQQRQVILLVLVLACLSLIGCLPYCVLCCLNLLSVHFPQTLWTLATWLLYIRSAVTPAIYPLCVSEYRHVCGRCFTTHCVRRTGSYEGRGTATLQEVENHVAFQGCNNVVCRSIGFCDV